MQVNLHLPSSELFADDTKSPIEHYYGIRYGGRMAIVWIVAQIGLGWYVNFFKHPI